MNMKHILWVAIFVIAIVVVVAQQPTMVSLQGKVTDPSGNPTDNGNLRVTVSTSDSCEQNVVYDYTYNNLIQGGLFSILLGNDTNLNLTYNNDYYLCTYVNSQIVSNAAGVNRTKFRGGHGQIHPSNVTNGTFANGNYTFPGNVTATAFYGNGTGLTGVTSNDDEPWEFVSWTNISSTRGWANISLPSGNAFKLEFMLFSEPLRCDLETGEPPKDEATAISFSVNNMTGTHAYFLLNGLNASGFYPREVIGGDGIKNTTIARFDASTGVARHQAAGTLYFYQYSQDIIVKADVAATANATILLNGDIRGAGKISEINLMGKEIASGCTQKSTNGRINGTVILYKHRKFRNY